MRRREENFTTQIFILPYDRNGLLEAANHGALFMDEIANLPLDMQAKFMRVLQEGEIRPVGSNQTRRIDVRFITASSQALHKLIELGKFREDLFYRLHVYPISLPSLCERQPDIPLLAEHFLHKFSRQQQKQIGSFHAAILAYLKQRWWEGNIRQLENFIDRLVTLAEMKIFDTTILPPDIKKELQQAPSVAAAPLVEQALPDRVAEYEARLIRQALDANDWSQSQAAKQLRIPVQTLHYKMNKLGLAKPE